jgi:hypothetical protein
MTWIHMPDSTYMLGQIQASPLSARSDRNTSFHPENASLASSTINIKHLLLMWCMIMHSTFGEDICAEMNNPQWVMIHIYGVASWV